MSLNRRGFLSSTALMALAPQLSFAQAQTDRRFIFIIQRGAADGLNTVIPYADPAYAKLRGALAIDPTTALKLDGTFALHPALSKLHELYGAGEASLIHAVAFPTVSDLTLMVKMFWKQVAKRLTNSKTAG